MDLISSKIRTLFSLNRDRDCKLSQNMDNYYRPDAEVVEVELVRGLRHGQGHELFPVLVDVDREPSPVAVLTIVEVIEAALSEKKMEEWH